MPQMSPINWSTLYITLITLFLFMVILSYFLFYIPQVNNIHYQFKKLNWKW